MKPSRWILLPVVVLASSSLRASAQGSITSLVSHAPGGVPGNGHSYNAAISADGRLVTFESEASNLVPGDTNGCGDVFLHDRATGNCVLISMNLAGGFTQDGADRPCLSGDGRFVAFASSSGDLVLGDTNQEYDVFVRDLQLLSTERVSVGPNGAQGDDESSFPSIASDGRFITFSSWSSNLVTGSWNGREGVYLRDRQTGLTSRISQSQAGVAGDDDSGWPAISGDGRFVAFESWASNLVANHPPNTLDVFVHDRLTGQVDLVGSGNGESTRPSISTDGRFVAFQSMASDLVPNDTNGAMDVFVVDRQTGAIDRISVDGNGAQGNLDSGNPSISGDGRFIAYESLASNLVPNDSNGYLDAFLFDRLTGTTARVTESSGGLQANLGGGDPSISGDGLAVAFESLSSNLVPGDGNGMADAFVQDRNPEFLLAAVGSCPGPLEFIASGSTPRGLVAFIWGLSGTYVIPPGKPCAGTILDLVPLLTPPPGYLSGSATLSGVATVLGTAPPAACGRVLIQALDLETCRTSNPVPL